MCTLSHSVVYTSLRTHGLFLHGIFQARILEWVAISNPNMYQYKFQNHLGKKKKKKRYIWLMLFILNAKYIYSYFWIIKSHQIRSVAQSCPTLCDPMNRSMPGLLVHHQLPKFTQTHVHRVSDAIQPSHPLSSPSPPAPNPSQHQSLFQ